MKYIFKKMVISSLLCFLITVAYAQPNITKVEYYIDIDPGFGNGINVSITASRDIQNTVIPINPATVSEGVHRFYTRAKDANGNWSLTNTLLFYKPYGSGSVPPPPSAPTNITRVEYYIDNDPGFGNGTNISIPSSADVQNVIIPIDPGPLAEGVHRFYVRSKDANGSWSLTNTLLFFKPYGNGSIPAVTSIAKMSKLEFYIDTDPGYGNGVPVALDSLTNFADYVVPVNVTGLTTGDHTFWVRGLDRNGNWSMMNNWAFTVQAVLSAPSIVVNSITDKINCARDSFDISFHATGTYNSGNKFNVELSDAAGNFASPAIIGSYTGLESSIIRVKLPSHLTDGTGYKIRATSTNPVVTGIAISSSITIHDRPSVQTITGAGDANATFSYPYSVPTVAGSSWQWLAPSATITQTNNSASLLWNTAGQPETVKVIETNQYGCVGDTSMKLVNVYDLKIENVASSTLVPCPDGTVTITGNATGVYNAGNVFTAELSDASGSFTNPVTIGTVAANPVGISQSISINATLPFPLANGTGYRVRINANSPVVTGSDNGKDMTVDKPDLGADKSITISCSNGTADLTTVYNLTGLTAIYDVATPTAAPAGKYTIIVTNANGCKDTADITVMEASITTVPASGSSTVMATRECTDAQGWTHYYSDNGTPADYSDDIRLLSLKKNGSNIGSVGDGTFQLKVEATSNAGSNHAVHVRNGLVPEGKDFWSMNRYWIITPTTQPASSVGVRFYYNSQDLADINGDYPGGNGMHTNMSLYKLQDGNPDPTTNWSGATAANYYTSGATPSLTDWVYTDLGNNTQQAEFMVSSFSGGGAGIISAGALPVTFTSFNVTAQKDKVALSWTTATEINSKEFSVQRSLDGFHFETIGFLPAAGNSAVKRNYRYDDLQSVLLTGKVVFYRIMETDKDGHSFYTDVKNVKISGGKNLLTMAFNPVHTEVLLRFESLSNEKVQVRVLDNLGRVALVTEQSVQKGANEIKLKTENLAKGIYEIVVSNSRDQYHVRMMKE